MNEQPLPPLGQTEIALAVGALYLENIALRKAYSELVAATNGRPVHVPQEQESEETG